MSWTEVAGFLTGALCVWLVERQHIANFPVGIANNVFYIVLFGQVGLYADAALQVVYIGLALLGWHWWLRGGPARTALRVTRAPVREVAALAALTVLGTWAVTALLTAQTDSTVPVWDALTTVLSLVATYLLSRKRLESWWVWIVADVLYVALYAYKELYLTSVLYAGFLALCIAGLRSWRQSLPAPTPAPTLAVR